MDGEIEQRIRGAQYDRAFELLLAAYQDRVFRLSIAMLGDRARAEEVAQDVFVRIWKSLAKFRGESSLSTWIYAITRNTCLTALSARPAASRGLSLESPGVRFAAERAGSSAAPDHSPDIWRHVAALPDAYRRVVLLIHLEERSYEEVACMLDLPLGTVKTHLHRARKLLAEALASENQANMAGRGL